MNKKIAYILSQFPETHETFILREIKALLKRGVDLKVLSLKPCRDRVVHPEARELKKMTLYGKAYSLWSIVYGLLHPISTLKALLYVNRTYQRSNKDLIKAIYVFLECLYFARYIKKEEITHIHGHWATMPTTAAVILSTLTGVPFSFTAHAWDIFVDRSGLEEKIRRSKFVVTCTDYNRKFLNDLCNNSQSEKIYLNYHGVDLIKFSIANRVPRIANEPLRILSIGRLVETKGFEYLIEACCILRDREIDFECLIVGSGPLLRRHKSHVKRHNLGNNVKFVGVKTQDEIRELYGQATVLVQPSVIAKNGDRDGIPNVILEAMSIGVPVVSTDISGIPEAIIHDKTGVLVQERDRTFLAFAIERLWKNVQLRKKIIKNGRQLIEEKFSTDKNIEALINIFKENGVLDDGRGMMDKGRRTK
ncbi:glycosyltransferase family 4 protein [Candidatus Omnitrophota bacterium]